jgi:hypothetical protein
MEDYSVLVCDPWVLRGVATVTPNEPVVVCGTYRCRNLHLDRCASVSFSMLLIKHEIST